MSIIVKRRSGDFVAHIEGHKECWESGITREDAVGKLLISYPYRFGITIKSSDACDTKATEAQP